MIRTYPARLVRSRRTRLVAAASAGVIAWSVASAAAALPTGGVVFDSTPGPATTITPGSGTLTVDQGGDRVVIDWSTFNIATGETVTFNQPNAGAIAFNRVDPSAFTTIDGTLAANGGVWLFSPGGLLFGAGAQVNVGSFVGSTARLQDADATAALSSNTITATDGGATGSGALTVTNGATLTATDGYMVLLGETIVQNGQVVSNSDAVWYGVAEGGALTITTGTSGQTLQNATVSSTAGSNPSFTQGASGVTTAGTWVGMSTAGVSGWTTVLNLGGSITATGVKPGTTQGVVILTGAGGVVDETAGDVVIDASNAAITSSDDIYVVGGAVTLGAVTASNAQIDILADSLIEITGLFDTDFSDVTLTTSGAGSLIEISSTMDLSTLFVDSAGDVNVTATGDIDARTHTLVAYGDTSISMTAAGDLTVVSGAQVDGRWDVYLETTGGASELSVDSLVHSGGLLSIDGSYNVTLGADADVNGFSTALNSIEITAGNDLDIQAGALVDAYDNMALTATGGDLTFAGTAYGDFVDLDAGADLTVASTGDFVINQFHADAVGDIQIDGVIDAPTTLFITSTGGDVTIGATANLSSFSIGIVAQDQLTTATGSHIDGDGGIGTLSFRAYGVDGADAALELSGDIIGHNIQLVASAGSTVLGGTITASNDVNVYAQGGDFTTLTGSLIDNSDGRFYVRSGGDMTLAGDVYAESVNLNGSGGSISQTGGTITVETTFDANAAGDFNTSAGAVITSAIDYDAGVSIYANGDLTLNGAIYGYDVFLDSEGLVPGGTLIEIGGSVKADNFLFIYAEQGDIHLAGTADLYAGTATTYGSIYIGAEGSITTDAGSQIHTTAYDGYVSLYANDTTGSVDLSGDISSTRISLGSNFGDVDVTLRDGSLTAAGSIYFSSSGDLTTAAGTTITAQGNVYLFGDTSADISGDITGDYVSIFTNGDFHQRAGTITVHDGGFYSYSDGDTFTGTGALIQAAAVGGDHAIIYLNAGHDLYLAGDIDGSYFVTINSSGVGGDTMLEISGSIYATDFIVLYNDFGDIHLTGTADVYVGTPNYGGDPFIYIGAEGSILADAGSSLGTAAGFADSYIGIYANDVTGSIDLAGDISSGNVYIAAYFGDVDVIVRDGAITAEGIARLYSSGDLTVMDGATIDAAYATLQLNGPDGGLIRIDGDISTTETIAISNFVGDVEIGATATLHANTDASADNGGPLGYQTDTIEIRGEGITAEAGSQILVGDLGDPYRGTVSIISDDLVNNLATTVTLDGYIKAEGIDVSVVDGSIEIDGDIFTTGDLAFDVTGTFTVGTNGYIYNAGYLHVIAEDGIVFDGVAFTYGVELTTTAPGADISIGGDIFSAFDINIESAGDLALGAGGTLQADFLYSAGGAINLTAEGTVSTGLGSRIIVGHVGATTGDVVITANGADTPTLSAIDLSGYLYADGLGLIAPNGSIHLGAGGIYLTEGLDIDAAFDFLMDADAYIYTPGAVSITAQGDLIANGVIYSGDQISLHRSGASAGDLTMNGALYAYGDVSIVNDGGDTTVGGDIDAGGGVLITSLDGDLTFGSTGSIYAGGDVDLYLDGAAAGDLSSLGLVHADGHVRLINASGGDVILGGTVISDADVAGSDGYIYVSSAGAILAPSGGLLQVGGGLGATTGDVILFANGADGVNTAAMDLDLDIIAETIQLSTTAGSIHIRGGDISTRNALYIDAFTDFTLDAGAHLNGRAASNHYAIVIDAGGDISISGQITAGDLTIDAGDAVFIDGDMTGDTVDITSAGDFLLGAGGNVSGTDSGAGVVHVNAGGDLTVADGSYLGSQHGDVLLETTDAAAALQVDGSISGANIAFQASGDLGIGATGEVYADYALSLLSDGPSGTAADITIDGKLVAPGGISIINRNNGSVTFGSTADVSNYYYYCEFCLTTPPTALLGMDGDIYIYSAGAVVTADGSVIDATLGVGFDNGLITIVSGGTDGTYSAIDLSGDIISYDTVLTSLNGSIHLGDGTITATDSFYATSAGDFTTSSGSIVDVNIAGSYGDLDIVAEGDILLGGVLDGYYIDITSNGTIGTGGSLIEISGLVYATDGITITNLNGDINVTATGEVYAGIAYEHGYSYVSLTTYDGVISSEAGSYIHTAQGYGSFVALEANVAGGMGIDLAGDITSDHVYLRTPDAGTIQITGGTIDATYDILIESGGQVHITGGVLNATDLVSITSSSDVESGDILLAGDIYADVVDVRVVSGPIAADIQIEGSINAGDYLTLYDIYGAITLTSTGELHGNLNGNLVQANPAISLTGDSVVTEAGDIYADVVDVRVVSGPIAADIQIDGTINAGDYLTIYDIYGAITLTSTGALHGNLNENLAQTNPAISLTGDSVVTEAGSVIDTPAAAPNSRIEITSTRLSGVGVDLAGDINGGDVTIRSMGDNGAGTAGVVISGDVNAIGDITVDSYGELTITADGSLTAGVLVDLSSRDQMLIAGDIYGRYLHAEINGLNGVDGAAIRVEGGLYLDRTIALINQVGDVEIGAGAQVIANLDGLTYQTYQTYDVEIIGEDILTEAGSLITTGAAAGPRLGAVLIESSDPSAATTLVDLSGDIDTDLLQILTNDGSLHIRDGQIDTIADLVLVASGYFTVDGPADIYSQGDFFSLAYAGTTINGDITADRILVQDFGGPELVVGGTLTALEDITVRTSGDLRVNGGQLISDSDNATALGEHTGVFLEADGQVSTSAGSLIRVGPTGAPTGIVMITADGFDGGGYAAIDLSGDIEAQSLYLDAAAGSIRLRDGDIVVTSDLYIDTGRDFIMNGPATITTPGDVTVYAGYSLSVAGEITAGDDIYLTTDGTAGSALTMNGTLTADGRVLLLNYGGDIVLGGAYITSDADATGGGDIFISAEGDVIAPGGGLLSAGPANGAPTDDITIRADGFEHTGNSTIDLAIDISAQTLTLYTDAGSIDIAGGDIYVTEDLTIDVPRAFTMGASATITGLGDVNISSGTHMDVAGDITAGGDILLELYSYGFSYFTAGPGDMVVNGAMAANGSVFLHNYVGGDIYLGPNAALAADADNSATGDLVEIIADEQVISAAGSTIQVGPSGTPTGDVSITANGGDNASYSAVDLSGDIEAQTLVIDAGAGSIHLADGLIDVTQDLTINSAVDFLMDGPAAIYADAGVSITAARSLVADGDIHAGGDITLRLQGANALDIDVGGQLVADGDVDIGNLGSGDVNIDGAALLDAGQDVIISANGDIVLDGVLDATQSVYVDAGGDLGQAAGGDILAGGDISLTSGGDMTLDGQSTADGDLSAYSDGGLDIGGDIYAGGSIDLLAISDMTIDGQVTADAGDIDAYSAGDMDVSGDMDAGLDIYLHSNGALTLSGDLFGLTGIEGRARYVYQTAGSLTSDGNVVLNSSYDMVVDGDIDAGGDARFFVLGGDGPGDLDINGDITADDDVVIYNYTTGDIHLGPNASVIADANANGGEDVHLGIYSRDGHIITDAGSTLHVGDVDTRTGFVSITSYGSDNSSYAAVDLSGDIDAGSVSIWSDGSVHIREGSISTDNDTEIYAAQFFILDTDGVISGSENPANAFPNPGQGVVYFDMYSPPGVSIAASDVTIDGQITSGDAIAIAANNVSGGEVTVGGADSASLGTGFTLSNDEFQNLDAGTIIFFSGPAEAGASGYDLHIADLTIDSANVGEVFFGTTEDMLIEGAVSPVGSGVSVNFGFGLLITDPGLLQPGAVLADFVPNSIEITGSLGDEANPFGSVTLIAQGDILMGSQAFIDAAAADPDFDSLEQSGDYDGAESGHIFVASDILQMASMGRILQQNTGAENEYAGLIIGEPLPGQELIFVPSILEGETIGGSGGWIADFSAGPSRIELFGVITRPSGDITGFNAALVDNLLDPDILVGEYFINSCKFGTQDCAFRAEDVPPFQSPFPPVDVKPVFDESASFFANFPFAEPADEDEEDEIQGEPVTGSGNEDLWTVKSGVRP